MKRSTLPLHLARVVGAREALEVGDVGLADEILCDLELDLGSTLDHLREKRR